MNQEVEQLFLKPSRWQAEMIELRRIALECGLAETVKWRQPCYTVNNKNVAIIGSFKEYCLFGFFKGVLLDDPDGMLEQAGTNTQSARHLKFTGLKDILEKEQRIKAFIQEAMANEKAGKQPYFKKTEEYVMSQELKDALASDTELRTAWEQLTPGRQRGYILHFSGAKQSATRSGRIQKARPRILLGKGLLDR